MATGFEMTKTRKLSEVEIVRPEKFK